MEFKKGCPACEHTDPQLELELEQLARLLVEDYLQEAGMLPIVFPADPKPSPKKTRTNGDSVINTLPVGR